jgi:hypothetical protein
MVEHPDESAKFRLRDVVAVTSDRVRSDDAAPTLATGGAGTLRPGTEATGRISSGDNLARWLFASSGPSRVHLKLRSSLPSALMLILFRRAKCTSHWSPVAWGRAGIRMSLPGQGEYLVTVVSTVRGADNSFTLTFTGDHPGLVDQDRQHPKLAGSWLREDSISRLRKAKIHHFQEIAEPKTRRSARRAGLTDAELDELVLLAKWLDVPWITHSMAAKLVRSGLSGPSDYYRLSRKDQNALMPLIGRGTVPATDQDLHGPCVALEGPPDGEPLSTPVVDWTWKASQYGVGHTIDTRPWWGSPIQEVTAADGLLYLEQQHWYPDPRHGWDVLAYDFTGDLPVGYLLVYNRYSAALRLFIYIPNVNFVAFSQLAAQLTLINPNESADRFRVDTWTFPLADLPPATLNFQPPSATPAIGGGLVPTPAVANFDDVALSPSFVWRGSGGAYDNLAPTGNLDGTWVRTEIASLFDPSLYPETQPLREAAGCLRAVFPWLFPPQPAGLTARDMRSLRLTILGLQLGEADLFADLDLDLTGDAVPTTNTIEGSGRSTLGAVKETVSTGIAAGAGAATVAGFLGITAASTGGIGLIAAAGIAGGFFGLFGGADSLVPPRYRIGLVGAARGPITGTVYTTLPVATFDLYLDGTFTPVSSDPPQPLGYPEAYQRCADLRLGSVGFQAPESILSLDPRPETISVWWLGQDPSNPYETNFFPMVAVGPAGSFQLAPWAAVQLTNVRMHLEIFTRRPQLPHSLATLYEEAGPGPFGSSNQITFEELSELKSLSADKRLYLRWFATLVPNEFGVNPFDIQYALDVGDRLEIEDMPAAADPPDPDW